MNQNFLMEIEIIVINEFIEGLEILSAVCVGEGIAEGEIYFLSFIFERILKDTLKLSILPHY